MAAKTRDEVKTFTAMVARKQGWTLTRDASFSADLIDGLKINHDRYGYFLCPCRDTRGSRDADAAILCPCVYAKTDIAEYGHCFCSLYQTEAFAASGAEPRSIPDRHAAF